MRIDGRHTLGKTASGLFVALAALGVLAGCQLHKASRDARLLLDMLESPDVEKRRSALQALRLRQSKRDMGEVLPALIRRLDDPDSEVRFYALDAIRQQTGAEDFPDDPEEAWEYFKKHKDEMLQAEEDPPALQMRRAQAEIKNARGVRSMLVGEHRAAQNLFAEALALDFENPAIHNNLGLAYFNQEFYKVAVGKFEDALSLDRAYIPAVMNLGRSYAKLAEVTKGEESDEYLEKAQDKLEEVIRREPRRKKTNWAARHALARVYFKKDMSEKAIETMEAAVRIMPNAPELRITLAIIYYGAEMYYGTWKQLVIIKRLGARPNDDFIQKVKEKLKETGKTKYIDLHEMDFPEDDKNRIPLKVLE